MLCRSVDKTTTWYYKLLLFILIEWNVDGMKVGLKNLTT